MRKQLKKRKKLSFTLTSPLQVIEKMVLPMGGGGAMESSRELVWEGRGFELKVSIQLGVWWKIEYSNVNFGVIRFSMKTEARKMNVSDA